MRLIVAAGGKWAKGPERELFALYAERLPWELSLLEARAKPGMTPAEETTLLFDLCKKAGAHRIVALDESGRTFSSPELAERIGAWRDGGDQHIGFIIGGHAGLDKAMLKQADAVLSFGRVTWPHLLMRTLLAEQLYRAWAILNRHPYHHG